MPKGKPPEPEISEEAKKALQAGWDRAVAAGDVGFEKPEEAGKKPEKKAEQVGSKEKKDFFDKVLSFTRGIGEKWQNFRNREVPLENLQQRYEISLTPEEQAADEALMKKAEAEKAALEQKFAAMTAEEHGEAGLDESLKRGELELEEETLSKEYEQLAQEVAKEGEEESDLYKKVLEGKAEMPPLSEAGAKLNETYRRLTETRLEREKLDREAAARKAYEATAKKAEKAAPATEEAPAAVTQAKLEEKPVETPKEAEEEPTAETSEEALARMEAANEKLLLRETELEGMVEVADDVASGKLKKTDLSAAQMLWLEKAGEVESAREELANTREARGLLKKQIEARKPPTASEAVPEATAAEPEKQEKKEIDPRAALQRLIENFRRKMEEPNNYVGLARKWGAMKPEDIPKSDAADILDMLKAQKRGVKSALEAKRGLDIQIADAVISKEEAEAIEKAGLLPEFYQAKSKIHQQAVDLLREIVKKFPEGELEQLMFVRERTVAQGQRGLREGKIDQRSHEERFEEQLKVSTPETAVAAAATAVGAEIAEAELKASEERGRQEREPSGLLDSVGKKIGQGLQRAAADLAKAGMTEKQLGAATEKDDRFIGQLLKSGLISPNEAVAMQSLKGKLDKLRNDFRAEVKKAIKEGRKRGRKRPAAKAPPEASL